MGAFLFAPTSHMWNTQFVQDNYQIMISMFVWIFYFIVIVKVLSVIEWSNRLTQLCWLLSIEWLTNLSTYSNLFSTHVTLVSLLRSTLYIVHMRCLFETKHWIRHTYLSTVPLPKRCSKRRNKKKVSTLREKWSTIWLHGSLCLHYANYGKGCGICTMWVTFTII